MSGSEGARVECTVCGHAWRVTATDADRGSTWCDLCQEPRTMDGQPPIWLERGRSTTPAPESSSPAASRPASGLGLLLKRSQPAAPASAPQAPASAPAPARLAAPHSRSSSSPGYPATIHHRGPGHRQAAVRLPGPIMRHLIDNLGMRFDRPARGGDALVTTSGDVRPGDRVLLRVREGQLFISETLTAERYARETNRQAEAFLTRESQPFTHIDEIRAARLRLEAWLGLSRDDRHPWAIPGELKGGSLLLSRRMLSWCRERCGSQEEPENWLQRGFPRPEDWGPGPMSFCARLEEHDPRPRFRSLVVSAAEHQAQQACWKRLLDTRSHAASGPAVALPTPLLGLMRRLELPVPRDGLPESQAILSAWSAARSPALARRAMAMFLLERVETETQRAALRGLGVADRQIESLHERWREAGRPAAALQGMVEPDEIGAALESLAQGEGARQISAGLLGIWEGQLSKQILSKNAAQVKQTQQERQQALSELSSLRRQSTELQRRQEQETRTLEERLRSLRSQVDTLSPLLSSSERSRPALPSRPASRAAACEELSARGLSSSPEMVDRLLLAYLSSPQAGTLLLLSDPTGRAPAALADLFDGSADATVSVRAEWSAESDLLGRVSPDGLRFVPAPFTEAVRQASAHALITAKQGQTAPFLLHLRDADRADPSRYAAGLLSALDSNRQLELYPRSLNARWQAELEQMKTKRAHDSNRFAELKQAFSTEALGGGSPESAWKLHLPPQTVILATLTRGDLSGHLAALREHSFVIRLPSPNLADVLSSPASRQRSRLTLPPRPQGPYTFPTTRALVEDGLRTLLPMLPPPAPRLGRQLAALISEAARWEMEDGAELAGHLLALTALPRLRGSDRDPLIQLASRDWITDAFSADLTALLS